MDNPTEYTILEADNRYELSSEVTEAMRDGWVCHLGPVIVKSGHDGFYQYLFYQAMVR